MKEKLDGRVRHIGDTKRHECCLSNGCWCQRHSRWFDMLVDLDLGIGNLVVLAPSPQEAQHPESSRAKPWGDPSEIAEVQLKYEVIEVPVLSR